MTHRVANPFILSRSKTTKAVGLGPANPEALIDAIAANHGLKAHRDAHLKAQRKPQVAHEDEAQLAQTEAAIEDAAQQLAYNDAGIILSDAPLQLAQAETAAAGGSSATGGVAATEAAAAGTAASTTATLGGISMGTLALGTLAVAGVVGVAAAASSGGGSSTDGDSSDDSKDGADNDDSNTGGTPQNLSLRLRNDTGASGSDGITRDGTVTVSGLEPGATWEYSTDGGNSWNAGIGTSFVLFAGTYAQGMVQVRQIDAAGNVSGVVSNPSAITVDTTAPTQTVANVDISADTGTSGTDFITNTAAQTITGTLSAALGQGNILYGSVDGGNTWTNITSKVNGTAISWDGVNPESGSNTIVFKVEDAVGNSTTSGSRDYVLDTAAPTISSVAIVPATGIQNDTLNAGDVVTVKVTMSEPVTVSGNPQLALKIGTDTVYASYDPGNSTSTALVFTYQIQADQSDSDGISIDANSLGPNSITLQDTAGNNAVLTHPAVADKAALRWTPPRRPPRPSTWQTRATRAQTAVTTSLATTRRPSMSAVKMARRSRCSTTPITTAW